MKFSSTPLPGLMRIEPRIFGDARGWFFESFNARAHEAEGLPTRYVQDNVSCSERGVVRGLHFQNPNAQDKLVSVVEGAVFDAVVDLRVGSPTFGRSYSLVLSGDDKGQLFVPAGFAHGFCTLTDRAIFSYKVTAQYSPADELGVAWDDPDLGIDWPIETATLSPRDGHWPRLRDLAPASLFRFTPR